MSRISSTCNNCRQTDDHPKIHFLDLTWHHDCLPPEIKAQILGNSSGSVDNLRKIISASIGGTRGSKLSAYIEQVHKGSGVNG